MGDWTAQEAEAYGMGKQRAEAEATWYFEDEATASKYLKGIEDGDPEILDTIGRAPLSGEWADDYGMSDLRRDFSLSDDEDDAEALDEIATAYEEGYWETIQGAVEAEARKWTR